jgi:glutathione peroxidase
MTRGKWQAIGWAGAAAALVAVGFSIPEYVGRDLREALAPIAVLSDSSSDDSAGDAMVPDNGERFLPVPAPFDDERVVDAFGPLAKLSCQRNDPPDVQATVAADALDAPLASIEAANHELATGPLLAAAAAPLAPGASPAAANATRAEQAALADMPAECPALLRYRFNRLQTGEPQSLCQFQGKVLVIVNTASYCGYTGQYEGLEALYRKYKGRGLVVVGFPSNDFGGQEPGSNQEIAQFCRLTYGVQFPMFEKSSVTKVSANPLFASLTASTGVAPQWNFYKYVVDRNGQAVAGYGSRTTPDDRELVRTVERLLAEKPKG